MDHSTPNHVNWDGCSDPNEMKKKDYYRINACGKNMKYYNDNYFGCHIMRWYCITRCLVGGSWWWFSLSKQIVRYSAHIFPYSLWCLICWHHSSGDRRTLYSYTVYPRRPNTLWGGNWTPKTYTKRHSRQTRLSGISPCFRVLLQMIASMMAWSWKPGIVPSMCYCYIVLI